ncbi:hypothetical protein POUND7_008679, partial [Theobroma cacao]
LLDNVLEWDDKRVIKDLVYSMNSILKPAVFKTRKTKVWSVAQAISLIKWKWLVGMACRVHY